ncbi:MAG TPA: aminotransferase class V-fold PLP-dependent enzyme [Gaiellaceae bacterium]
MSFRDDLASASDWVATYLETIGERPVVADVKPGEIRARLPASPPERAEPFADVLRDFDEVIVPGLTLWNHPRFFAYFANTGSEPGVLAELLTAALNVNAMAWLTSPAATELEQVVLEWLAELIGLPPGLHGHIEDTASTSTLAALAAARTLRPGGAVYASEQAHFSIEKAVRILGLELRTVPVDDEFRMLPGELDPARLRDAAAVVATVGTTSSVSVDPVRAIAERCRDNGVWLHVDAAYAGSAAVCPELRWCLDGVEHADSIVVNPHKWLFTPMDCSTFWTRRPEALRAAFAAHGDYLASTEGAVDFRDHGPALGRRFRSLKLWTVLRCYGREGLQAAIREHVRQAALFEEWVRADAAWEISAPRHFSTVCFRHREADNEEIARRATATGRIFVATTKLRNESVIRLAIGNGWTREEDVREAWEVLRECAR